MEAASPEGQVTRAPVLLPVRSAHPLLVLETRSSPGRAAYLIRVCDFDLARSPGSQIMNRESVGELVSCHRERCCSDRRRWEGGAWNNPIQGNRNLDFPGNSRYFPAVAAGWSLPAQLSAPSLAANTEVENSQQPHTHFLGQREALPRVLPSPTKYPFL